MDFGLPSKSQGFFYWSKKSFPGALSWTDGCAKNWCKNWSSVAVLYIYTLILMNKQKGEGSLCQTFDLICWWVQDSQRKQEMQVIVSQGNNPGMICSSGRIREGIKAPCSCVSAQCSDSFQHFFTPSKGIPPLLKEETMSGMKIASTSCCTGCIQLRSIFLLL